ncbi:MAG: hypothetical protein AB7T49_16470 [Oligoflexales bacterium]
MSQVIVEEDNLKDKRLKSKTEEARIQVDSAFKKWQNPSGAMLNLIQKGAGIAALPVALFWTAMSAVLGILMGIVAQIFHLFGALCRGNKSSS